MVSVPPSCIYIKLRYIISQCDWWLVDIMRLYRLATSASEIITLIHVLSILPWVTSKNCTFGNNFYLDEFEDRASLWHWAKRLKQGLLDKDNSPPLPPPVDLYADTITNLVHADRPPPPPRALRWHSAAVESNTFARVPILTSSEKKNAKCLSHTGCRDTDELSLALSWKRLGLVYENCQCLFRLLNSPSHSPPLSPQTGCSSRPRTCSPPATRMEICCTRNPASHSAYYQE